MAKKSVLQNGIVVGEIETTGDLEKDAQAVQDYLKTGGTYTNVIRCKLKFSQSLPI